jgi:NAD(P)H-dependent FMN reductase
MSHSMMDPPRKGGRPLVVGVVVGSTRPGRRGVAVAQWATDAVDAHLRRAATPVRAVALDLADFELPLLDELSPAAWGCYERPHTRRWAAAVGACDAFVFVTPEYNHSVPGALKNALDFVFAEWHDKAAGLVGYGVDGGVRAVEHLRQILAELRVADVRTAVTLRLAEDFDGDVPAPRASQAKRLRRMVDEIVAWADVLRHVRHG